MSEEIYIPAGASKTELYESLLPQIKALIGAETDLTANMANICAVLKEVFDWWWVGFYLVKNDQLVLGPFQGPVACTRIGYGKGVCGTAWQQARPILVPDVNEFPGHIACSSQSVSEIVVPVFDNNQVFGVLDIDSDKYDTLDETDVKFLQQICGLITLPS